MRLPPPARLSTPTAAAESVRSCLLPKRQIPAFR